MDGRLTALTLSRVETSHFDWILFAKPPKKGVCACDLHFLISSHSSTRRLLPSVPTSPPMPNSLGFSQLHLA